MITAESLDKYIEDCIWFDLKIDYSIFTKFMICGWGYGVKGWVIQEFNEYMLNYFSNVPNSNMEIYIEQAKINLFSEQLFRLFFILIFNKKMEREKNKEPKRAYYKLNKIPKFLSSFHNVFKELENTNIIKTFFYKEKSIHGGTVYYKFFLNTFKNFVSDQKYYIDEIVRLFKFPKTLLYKNRTIYYYFKFKPSIKNNIKNSISDIKGEQMEIINNNTEPEPEDLNNSLWKPKPAVITYPTLYIIKHDGNIDEFKPTSYKQYESLISLGMTYESKEYAEYIRDNIIIPNTIISRYYFEYGNNNNKMSSVRAIIYFNKDNNKYHTTRVSDDAIFIAQQKLPENVAINICEKLNNKTIDLFPFKYKNVK